jgi:Cof subfamily protein (haloacid dehalogenase superfamily)
MFPNDVERAAFHNITLLISDVDGTLVTTDKTLTRRSIDAVKRLDEVGIAFTVTSSRPPRGLEMLIEPLDLRLPIGGFNGGSLVRPDFSVIERLSLDPDLARAAIRAIVRLGLDAWVYNDLDWFVRDADAPRVAHETRTIGFPPREVENLESRLDGVGKIVAVSDDPDLVTRCNAELNAILGGRASAMRSQDYFLDVTHPDANKGTLVTSLSQLLSIPTSQIATIGDMPNDVLMFRRSGLSIAMGNASAEVKAQAKLTTASNEEDGFTAAVDRLLHGRKDVS